MKKTLFFAAVVATALASCSSDDDLQKNQAFDDDSDNGMVPVELGLTRSAVNVYQTRGTGTVGDIADATNIYQNEDLYVLMTTVPATNNGVWEFTSVGNASDPNALGEQFNGTFKSRPVKESSAEDAPWAIDYQSYTGGQVKYYPTNGSYSEFFAFHVDDAVNSFSAESIKNKEGENLKYVEFKIDGTQDIMAGKAEKDDADMAIDNNRGYSAKTARRGIIPNIPMKHLLTRLTFGVTPGHKNALGVIIDSIKIVSRSEGELTVAYDIDGTKAQSDLIKWTQATPVDSFTLMSIPAPYTAAARIDGSGNKVKLTKESPLATIDSTQIYVLDSNTGYYDKDQVNLTSVNVGESFFVQPNQTQFPIRVFYRFPYVSGGTADNPIISYYNLADDLYVRLYDTNNQVIENGLEVGKSYHVNIIIYGLSDIKLRTTLENWVDGGKIDIDTADPIHTQE